MTDSNKPEVIRDGSLKASLWRNQGENGPYVTVDFARTYTDKDGNIKDSRSFSLNDVLKLSELSREAYQRGRPMERDLRSDHNAQREEFENNRRESHAPQPERENQR